MKKYFNKLMIIDGSYMLHRALRAPNLWELENSKGVKSGGIFGTLRMFQSELKNFHGYFPIFCWDQGLSARRTALYPDYKANRKRLTADGLIAEGTSQDEGEYLKEYHRQRSDLIMILRSMGVPSILMPGWEGDDLQYLLTQMCQEGVIISDDRDMIQLVSPTIKIRRSLRDEIISWDNTDAHSHYPRFVIAKSIIGDESDNIPRCVKGLGIKGAETISDILAETDFGRYQCRLNEYLSEGSVQKTLANNIAKLLDNWKQFEINYQLINLRLVEFPAGFDSLIKDVIELTIKNGRDINRIYQLLGFYEMNTIFPDQIISMVFNGYSQFKGGQS